MSTTISTTTTGMGECSIEYITEWNTKYKEREVQECITKWVPKCEKVYEKKCKNKTKNG